ncbi:hypothetical protein AQUCO_03700112v1 [Aquilegia coerulea]|uniref:Fcf2 pre-rRNA processing C-terminal domain-containing protein n=1 Tax=Aquilegia coerulea TaxID=218851 RepID=A0A2G5CTI9_AQUCA|nr:hypothetical protein AQUCO_03700112v1 [Aquilegia coerulea]PIA34596.1 hypothetical protein AQUCO_03700112v1 [Aquilegia coerulea]
MLESKSTFGLTWEPQIPTLLSSKTIPNGSQKLQNSLQNVVGKPDSGLIHGLFVPPNDPRKLNKLLRKQRKDTAGGNWFDMPAPTITPELKKDLQIIKLRSVLDPKRHYKKSDSKSKTLPKYFQVGTIIESPSEFFTGRLTKKERKTTFADELLSDPYLGQYRKRKIREIEEQKRPVGNEKWKNKGRQSYKRAKDRRQR